jgi:hypothetical protein
MIKTNLAKKKLTKKLQKHLTKMKIHSMRRFEEVLEGQRSMARNYEYPTTVRVCFECYEIAGRLGMNDKCQADYEDKQIIDTGE